MKENTTLISSDQGQLISLYHKWKESPNEYGNEMAATIDKIIYSTLHRQSLLPVYWKFEDRDDLMQELRLLCFQKLNKITDPSNKRIFNFLRISIKLALLDKTRKVGKRLDREPKEVEILGEKSKTLPSLFYFNDELLEQVATLISNGETQQYICKKLNISRTRYNKEINRLKNIYHEKQI